MSLLGTLYIAALIIGVGINVLQFVMAGVGADADSGDLDANADMDVQDNLDAEVIAPAGSAAHMLIDGGFLPLVLSLRFWTFGLLAFGLFGVPVHFMGLAPKGVTLLIAAVLGLGSGLVASWVFRALGRTSSQSGAGTSDAVGQVGRVLIPVTRVARGKVRVQLRGQTVDYLARSDDEDLEVGADVLVSEVRADEVLVCRAPAELRGLASDGPEPNRGD